MMIQTYTVSSYRKEVNFRYRTSKLPKPKSVVILGTWDNWQEATPLKYDKVNNIWQTNKIMNSGQYQYKFLVDNEWKYREELPYIENANFIVNYVLKV